jgi:hypothetical protein
VDKMKTVIENGEEVSYWVENKSYEDDYGSLHINNVPYRKDSKGIIKRLSPESYALHWMDAEQYIPKIRTLVQRCEHCGSEKWECR